MANATHYRKVYFLHVKKKMLFLDLFLCVFQNITNHVFQT